MYKFTINFHIVISSFFLILGLVVLIRAILGWKKNRPYTKVDNSLSISFVSLLYLQCVLGFVLYFFLGEESSMSRDAASSMENASLRFWVIEHFSVMIFTLVLAQIGRLFIASNIKDLKKFRNTAFYFGLSYLLSIFTAVLGFLR